MLVKERQLNKFIKVLLPFCLILFLADHVVGYLFEYSYNHQKQGVLYRVNYAVDSTKADCFVVGSSRATHHYDSDIISKATGYSFYNSGSEGRGVIYSAAVISASIHRYKPKLIIIDVRPNEFTTSGDEDLSALLPYYKKQYVMPYINYASDFQKVKLLSKIYPYNSLLTTMMAGRSNRVDANTFDKGGYIPMYGLVKNKKIIPYAGDKNKLDKGKVRFFTELLDHLEKEKIHSLIVMSPLYFQYKGSTTLDVCNKVVSRLKYSKFVNFSGHPEFKDPAKFDDELHLNNHGAAFFSSEIAVIISSTLNHSSGI